MLTPFFVFFPGCIMTFGATVPPPGRFVPDTRAGASDLALEIDAGRDLAGEVLTDGNGVTSPSYGPAVWPALAMAYRRGTGQGVGIEGRVEASMMFPLPFPLPTGFSLAPVFELERWEPGFSLHTSPRLLSSKGYTFVGFEGSTEDYTRAWGAEVPLMLTWQPNDIFACNVTGFARGYYVTSRHDVTDEANAKVRGTDAEWTTWGSGVMGSVFVTGGFLRVAANVGVEWVPEPLSGLNQGKAVTGAIPEGGLSLDVVWGGKDEETE